VVSVNPVPTATISAGGSICAGSGKTLEVTLTGNAPWSFTYSDGSRSYTVNSITSSPYKLTVTPAASTTYSITSVTSGSCTNNSVNSSTTVTVTAGERSVRYPTVTTTENVPTQLQARNFGANTTYSWSPLVGLSFGTVYNPVFRHNKQTQYLITITTPSGCTVVDTLLVRMTIESDLWVPKAWSPNSDGHNDKLFPLTRNIREIKYFRIFNRWGQLVFETNKLGDGWDGVFNGKPQISDVYTWTVEAVGLDDKYYKRAGNSVLLR
nr:gliding motility-associated C-terminal domain-containing protein [Segetibacter sp.]